MGSELGIQREVVLPQFTVCRTSLLHVRHVYGTILGKERMIGALCDAESSDAKIILMQEDEIKRMQRRRHLGTHPLTSQVQLMTKTAYLTECRD